MKNSLLSKTSAAGSGDPIKILIAEDHPLVREVVTCLIQEQTDMSVIGQAVNGSEALRLARELHPDVMVVDQFMPQLNGIEVIQRLHQESPLLGLIGFTMSVDPQVSADMRQAGANACVAKDAGLGALLSTIRSVYRPVASL